MLDVGWPDPALVLDRMESTRSWAASSPASARSIPLSDGGVLAMSDPLSLDRRVCHRTTEGCHCLAPLGRSPRPLLSFPAGAGRHRLVRRIPLMNAVSIHYSRSGPVPESRSSPSATLRG